MDPTQAIRTTMSFAVFKEPRGVMRILQFIFAICAFATTSGFSNAVNITLTNCFERNVVMEFDYPFRLEYVSKPVNCTNTAVKSLNLIGNFSSDAQFFVTTGVLSFIYCIAISLFYIMCDNLYQSNGKFPLADFGLTVTLAVFWLSGSAAWASGLSNLKFATSNDVITHLTKCKDVCHSSVVGSYSELDISVILGFLNFILWASDLWFLYKETPWFKVKQSTDNMGAKA